LETRQLLSAIVQTDHLDYAPGSTALITATNDNHTGKTFQPGETVQFQIDRTDGISIQSPPAIRTWEVTDGVGGFTPYQDSNGTWWFPDSDGSPDGNIGTSWYVDSQFAGASLEVTATGLSLGAVATATFTDAANKVRAVAMLHQSPLPVTPGNFTT
jgi:hypothetical protein